MPTKAAGPNHPSVTGPHTKLLASNRSTNRDYRAKTQPGLPRRRAGNDEANIQAGVVGYVRAVAPDVLIFHVPNGGYRTPAESARLKWTGTLAGVPDLCLIAPIGRVFFMEIKTATGRLSENQKRIHGWLTAIGVSCAVVRSVNDARNALRAWNIPTREHDPMAGLDPKTREAWRDSAVAWRAARDEGEQRGGDDE
jgi:hypothetical protein